MMSTRVDWDRPVASMRPWQRHDTEISDESLGGIPYNHHTESGETVWEKPDGFVLPLTVLQVCAISLSACHTNFDPTGRIEHCAVTLSKAYSGFGVRGSFGVRSSKGECRQQTAER
ncbi:hypothetical protein EDB86DRAFT_1237757 [Lactarius hatsudake]|nr:hypothetical protein EDB86DRAFT_1237757 [Lactarius hatsudake]